MVEDLIKTCDIVYDVEKLHTSHSNINPYTSGRKQTMQQTHMLVEVFELNQRKERIDMTEEDNGIIECGHSMASEELMLQSQLPPHLIPPRFPNSVIYASCASSSTSLQQCINTHCTTQSIKCIWIYCTYTDRHHCVSSDIC